MELAREKFNAELVLKALESKSPEERLASLKFIVETKLLKDSEIQEAVRDYAKGKESAPSSIPQVATGPKFETPLISNARIFLLAGSKTKESLFPLYTKQLETAGFRVLGAKAIVDPSRPSSEEVRFFHEEDREQAEKIAEVIRFSLSLSELKARLYSDESANQGYIEIWFGR